ncbi:MAG TPA: hypothetical protein VFZ65_08605 [Planctomycetota bacterium]|nr:hypothetical protein [Planctomycetota bacterium]
MRHDWRRAHDVLAAGDARGELDPRALELFAESARWIGRDDAIVATLERAHAAYTRDRDTAAAARTALALLDVNLDHGRNAVAATWFHRAEELLTGVREGREHALLAWFRARASGSRGEIDQHRDHARQALTIARRHGDRSVEALALVELGHVAALRGEHTDAFAAIERATAIASSGEAGLYAAGSVFCNAIWLFRCCGEWDRAHEWTEISTRWVERQQVEFFPALCRVHRSEVLRVRGRLAEAEREGEMAASLLQRSIPGHAVIAYAELGEVRRRRGDLDGAMAMFERALQLGWNPQPGLALALLARGEATAALRSIERVFAEPQPTLQFEDRASLQLARALIAIAAGHIDGAHEAVAVLEPLARDHPAAWTLGACREAQGRLALAEHRHGDALAALAHARRAWSDLDAPYELASTIAVQAQALAASGDAASARLEFATARAIFARIGADHDAADVQRRLDDLGDDRTDRPETVRPMQTAPGTAAEALLRRDGDYWTLFFRGRELRLRHARGLGQLAALLAAPGEPRWAIELAANPDDGDRSAGAGGDAGEVLDAEARRAYAARARDLEVELADARRHGDQGRIEAIRAEMHTLGRQLACAVGLGGRARRAASSVERARQSVTKAIRTAMRRISELDATLGDHLERSVRTGTSCTFDPGPDAMVAWRVAPRP